MAKVTALKKNTVPAAEKQGSQTCECDQYIEEARGLLALVLGTLKKDSSLQLSFIEMTGIERAVKNAYDELEKAANLHYGGN